MKTRLYLKHKWWTSQYSNPVFLYYDMELECFEVGSRATASKNKFEFTDEELEQLKKDYDLSDFVEERVTWGKEDTHK